MIKRSKLKNGLTVLWEPRQSDTVAIEICVGTGSNNEPKNIAGISHFLEHMLFEGTKTRAAKQISETIEDIGGELNAATSNERTFFYVKVPRDKFSTGLDILSDMVSNPAFHQASFDKEKKVVLEEIKMVNDQPLMYQWVLFLRSIFKRHPAKNPVYGNMASVKAMTRNQMLDYFRKWYVPKNMVISVVGGPSDTLKQISAKLGSLKSRPVPRMKKVVEPRDSKPTLVKEKRDTNQAYFIIGNKTVHRTHKDSFTLDVIASVFSKGLSGRINDEIRVKRGLAYSVGAHHESKKDYGFFVFHLNCDKKNVRWCKSIILDEVEKLSDIREPELQAAKDHIVGRILVEKENSQRRADELAFWENIKDSTLADDYIKQIKKISVNDITAARDRYLHKNNTMIVVSK